VRAVPLERTRALRRAVLQPGQTLEQVASLEPHDAHAVGAFGDGELAAAGFVMRDGGPGAGRIRGMATALGARGRGAGAGVLEALAQYAAARGDRRIWCRARTRARPFHERAGLRVVADEYAEPESEPHLVMELRPGAGG